MQCVTDIKLSFMGSGRSDPVTDWQDLQDTLPETDFGFAVLCGANLAGLSFKHAMYTNANLSQADLSSTWFEDTALTGANLTNALISGTRFENTEITEEQLTSTASYRSKNLRRVAFHNLSLVGWDLSHQVLIGASFRDAQLVGLDLSHTDLREAVFRDSVDRAAIHRPRPA